MRGGTELLCCRIGGGDGKWSQWPPVYCGREVVGQVPSEVGKEIGRDWRRRGADVRGQGSEVGSSGCGGRPSGCGRRGPGRGCRDPGSGQKRPGGRSGVTGQVDERMGWEGSPLRNRRRWQRCERRERRERQVGSGRGGVLGARNFMFTQPPAVRQQVAQS